MKSLIQNINDNLKTKGIDPIEANKNIKDIELKDIVDNIDYIKK